MESESEKLRNSIIYTKNNEINIDKFIKELQIKMKPKKKKCFLRYFCCKLI